MMFYSCMTAFPHVTIKYNELCTVAKNVKFLRGKVLDFENITKQHHDELLY